MQHFLAVLMVIAVITGFSFVPDRDLWIVWLTQYTLTEGERDEDIDLISTQEPIAIRAEVARLWCLYLPTVLALGFLTLMVMRGFGGFDISRHFSYQLFLGARIGIAAVWFLLASWVYERWLLRQAGGAQTLEEREVGRLGRAYSFVVEPEYYGGVCLALFSYREEPELTHVVMYRRANPQRSFLVSPL